MVMSFFNIYKFIFLFMFSEFLFSNQQNITTLDSEVFEVYSPKYSTNIDGEIMIYVNILGKVKSPGRFLVSEGVDFATLLSKIGGPINGANMSKVKIFRHSKENNNEVLIINLKKFIKYGDRSDFVIIKPNDTIIFPESLSGFIFSRLNSLNSILNLLTLYLTVMAII